MKNYIPLFVLFTILSCRKDPTVLGDFNAGSTNDVTVITHDSLVQAEWIYGYPKTDYVYIDLDSDGVNDLLFTSLEYVLNNPFDLENLSIYSSRVRIINDIFSIADIEGSNQIYEHYGEPTYDYDGTWPRETTKLTYSCDSLPNAKPMNTNLTVNYLVPFYPIDEKLSWRVNANEYVIREPKFETLYYEGNSGPLSEDSLIGFHGVYDRHCHSMPLDTQYYIPFKKTFGSKYKYGWILLDLTDNNKIAIFESAIQNEYN